MSIPKEQAQTLLNEAQAQMQRSAMLQAYQRKSDYLLVWGLVWLLAYLGTACWPNYSQCIWMGLDALGFLATVLLQRRSVAQRDAGAIAATLAAAWVYAAFVVASVAVFLPVSGRQLSTFVTLLVALAYALTGLRFGGRILLAGVALGALAMFVFYLAEGSQFQVAMGVLGGGTLIATGLWLKRV